MDENMGVMILQGVVMLLAVVILFMLYSEKNKTTELQNKIDNFKCPDCPAIPECPDCNCPEGKSCPDCVCENDGPTNLECPECPACTDVKGPSVDDIVNAIVNVSLNEPRVNKEISRIYNIGCGNPIKLIDFINLIENISGITFEKRYVDIQKGEVKSTHADVSKIILDYPNYKIGTQIDIGLKKFIDWYKNYILK